MKDTINHVVIKAIDFFATRKYVLPPSNISSPHIDLSLTNIIWQIIWLNEEIKGVSALATKGCSWTFVEKSVVLKLRGLFLLWPFVFVFIVTRVCKRVDDLACSLALRRTLPFLCKRGSGNTFCVCYGTHGFHWKNYIKATSASASSKNIFSWYFGTHNKLRAEQSTPEHTQY